MLRSIRWCAAVCAATGVLLVLTGCQEGSWGRRESLPPERPPRPALQGQPALADTIGSYGLLSSVSGQRVRGFSLVVGLGENGSRDCPTTIREYLVEYLSLQLAPQGGGRRRPRLSPEQLIDSLDTAVVEVVGIVPPGAPRGTRFDVQVQAIPGTATRSLEGGMLLPCDLKIYEVAQGREGLIGGRKVAGARGTVFTNPFASESNPTGISDPRQGFALSGGQTLSPRSVRLLLLEPSYSLARRIERRVNERFGHRPEAAEAMSKGYLKLHTPPEFAARPDHFIQLVTHLYLPNHPAFYERKLRELARMISSASADAERVSLMWEGIGRVGVAQIQPLYTHENPSVRFYAARAGLRLKDVTALPVMTEIAATPRHPHRLPAVKELGECAFPAATVELTPLLDDEDQEVRIAAYEGLLQHRHASAIQTQVFPNPLDPSETNLILDVVESGGEPLIYVRRTREPRVAVFGTRTPLTLPLFYSHPEERVVLNALAKTDDITLFYRAPQSQRLSEKIMVPPRLIDLIVALADLPVKDEAGRLRGVGLNYSQVVQVLAALEREGAIPARVVLERESLAELLGPAEIPERPETDEPPPVTEPPVFEEVEESPPVPSDIREPEQP